MRLPSLKSLRTFQVAGRHLSFKQAAEELSITASAVSHQIRNLETLLGVRLFDRVTRGLEFTDAGQKYFRFLDTMFSRLESETLQLWSQFGREIIRVCAPPFFASEALLPKLSSFQALSKNTDLRVTTQPSAMVEHPPEADISILLGHGQWPHLETHRLFRRQVVVACSEAFLQDNPIKSYAELNGQTLIVHDNKPDAWRDWATSLSIASPVPGRLIRSDSMSAIARAAQQGLGVALISWPLGRELFKSGSLVRVFDETFDTDDSFYVAHRPDDADRPELKQLREWIMNEFSHRT